MAALHAKYPQGLKLILRLPAEGPAKGGILMLEDFQRRHGWAGGVSA